MEPWACVENKDQAWTESQLLKRHSFNLFNAMVVKAKDEDEENLKLPKKWQTL